MGQRVGARLELSMFLPHPLLWRAALSAGRELELVGRTVHLGDQRQVPFHVSSGLSLLTI